ncbi:MAG TPA: hypothetical protein VGM10_34705 [Actinocrinis sp.]|jgi:hypothetical protein
MDVTPQSPYSASGPDIAADPAGAAAPAGRGSRRLRIASLVSLVLLLIEYLLGMGVNIFVKVPAADQGASIPAAIGKAMSNGPGGLAAHAGVGLLLVVNVTVVLILSFRVRPRLVPISSALAFLCVLGAAVSGARFVGNGDNGSSMAMATLTGVAIACYAANLFALGGRRV